LTAVGAERVYEKIRGKRTAIRQQRATIIIVSCCFVLRASAIFRVLNLFLVVRLTKARKRTDYRQRENYGPDYRQREIFFLKRAGLSATRKLAKAWAGLSAT